MLVLIPGIRHLAATWLEFSKFSSGVDHQHPLTSCFGSDKVQFHLFKEAKQWDWTLG